MSTDARSDLKPLWSAYPPLPEPRTLREIGDGLGVAPYTISRWFSKGERPSRQSLRFLARYFAKRSAATSEDATYRALYWHYSLSDLADGLVMMGVARGDVVEIAQVTAGMVRCARRSVPRTLATFAGILLHPPPPEWLDHAERHGAGGAWRGDAIAVAADYAGSPAAGKDDADGRLVHVLRRLPRPRPTATRSASRRSRTL
jgi:transcriptional regulator with XRE-family HTH domain